jgi:hypothetical protein
VTAVVRPISGNQLDKLGRRLALPGPISDEDYELLSRVADAYQDVADRVEQRLRDLGLNATTRVKTTGTLVDKLRRTPQLSLKNIHDVAGARIVIDGGRREQDQVVERIMRAFESCPKPPERIDRREVPSHGYRAVHVIVYEDSTPTEIQVRTKLQDTWAQITEKLGDLWGRGLRYGNSPNQPDLDAGFGSSLTRGEVIATLISVSDSIAQVEIASVEEAKIRERLLSLEPAARAGLAENLDLLKERLVARQQTLQAALDTLLREIDGLGGGS